MQTWKLIKRTWVNDTSAEYGYGDYARNDLTDTGLRVKANTRVEAQRAFKKLSPDTLRFSGVGYSHTVDVV